MKNLLIISFLILTGLNGFGQETNEIENSSNVHFGTIEDNFQDGKSGFYNVFMSKIHYPKERKDEGLVGSVWFEIEIDTSGYIAHFKILKGVAEWMHKEVEEKLKLTNGYWNPLILNGEKVNFIIRTKVYFELR